MKAYNLLSNRIEHIPSSFEIVKPGLRKPKFITISPHSGLYIPDELLEAAHLESEEVREEIFQDGDPFLNEFRFQAQGAIAIDSLLHRFAGDLNRDSADRGPRGFLPTKSFGGLDLLKPGKSYSNQTVEQARSWHAHYLAAVDTIVESFDGPVFMAQMHSMDNVAGALYAGGAGKQRPDICLIFGPSGEHMHPELEDVVYDTLRRELPDLSIAVNDPFDGNGSCYALLKRYGKPKQNLHAFELELNKRIHLNGNQMDELAFRRLQKALATCFEEAVQALSTLEPVTSSCG